MRPLDKEMFKHVMDALTDEQLNMMIANIYVAYNKDELIQLYAIVKSELNRRELEKKNG